MFAVHDPAAAFRRQCVLCGGRWCRKCGGRGKAARRGVVVGVRSFWADDRSVLAMARPTQAAMEQYAVMAQLHRLGVRAVLNLQEAGEHPSCGGPLHPGGAGFTYSPESHVMAADSECGGGLSLSEVHPLAAGHACARAYVCLCARVFASVAVGFVRVVVCEHTLFRFLFFFPSPGSS